MHVRTIGVAIAASLLLCTGVSAQTIYKSEKNGVTSYSTRQSPDATAVKLPELSVIPGTKVAPAQAPMPSLPVPDSMIPGNGSLLPPPPPSLGVKPPVASLPSKAELQTQLDKAKAALAEQDAVRFGDERNFQKKLDRLKPYQDEVDKLTKALGAAH